jgi:hypothetical protein
MRDDEVQLRPQAETEQALDTDLKQLLLARESLESLSPISERGGSDEWDAPFDLRVLRPRAIDLRKLWQLTGQSEPPGIAATLGARRPILINHVVTPFPVDGRAPGRVWGLGYEFVAHDIDANTVSVVPDDEVMEIAKVGQSVDLGLELGGKIGIADAALQHAGLGPTISLSGASLSAATSQRFQFALEMRITLRKVVGAGVGIGGAQWKLYRQNEPIDQPHTLLQTVLVPEAARSLRCSVKTWAKQGGRLGTGWGARFWPYPDQAFDISLAEL